MTASLNILLVDDLDNNRALISLILTRSGHLVTEAGDGKQAIQALRQTNFDVVITDILMPNLDGLELISYLNQLSARPAIVCMSGGGDYMSSSTALHIGKQMGAAVPLEKPFTAEQLRSAIAEAMARRKA